MKADRLRARWATGPEDVPAEGEAVARLERRGPVSRESSAGDGLTAPSLTYDPSTGDLAAGEATATDLSLGRTHVVMIVEAADGRRLLARFGKDVDAPQIDADAPADLRDALVRLWRARGKPGPPPGDGLDLPAIRAALRDYEGPWPPTEDQITGYSGRRVRQVLHDAGTSWEAETATRPVC